MPASPEKKIEIAERLLRGEDVEIKMDTSDAQRTDAAYPDIEPAEIEMGNSESIVGDSSSTEPHGSAAAPEGPVEVGGNIPVDLILNRLGARIGEMATEMAVLESKVILLEEELRNR